MKTALIGVCALSTAALAQNVSVTVENVNPSGGFFFTPFWVGFHNGGFDSYDGGTPASNWPGLTELAETGATGPISAAFAASPAGVAGGIDSTLASEAFPGDAPVYSPGESASFAFNVPNPGTNRYFSYASMVIPSNDLFVANGNPLGHAIFNPDGSFAGPLVIEIYGQDVNDNGSEVNDANGGAAFSANGGTDTDENGLIHDLFPGGETYLTSFVGSSTATGDLITSTFGPSDLIARITIVPAPGTAALALGMVAFAHRRRR